jgi:2-keto-4-pentenoate hydratase
VEILDLKDKKKIAGELAAVWKTAVPTDGPPSDGYPELNEEDAYEIASLVDALKKKAGLAHYGYKVGLTGKAVQDTFRYYEPIFGDMVLPPERVLADGGEIAVDTYVEDPPKLEIEVAFHMGADLGKDGQPVTIADAVLATAGIGPALEIIESHYPPSRTGVKKSPETVVYDIIADSGGNGGFVLGSKLFPLGEVDLRASGVNVYLNGKAHAFSTTGSVLGNPINSVVWLANKLIGLGSYLKAGDVVLTGSVVPPLPIRKGDLFTLVYDRLGMVSVSGV